jgi:DNA-binding XRE family transcriptional regulator
MGVLEIIAEQRLGLTALKSHPKLRIAFEKAEKAVHRPTISDDEKARIAAIIELCFEYNRESDPEEKANILRTLEEISANEALEMPTQSVEAWEGELKTSDKAYAKAEREGTHRIEAFLKKYFSLRAKSGLQTQAAVAKASGLKRGYVAIIETGEHFPQQKTLQKLAKAFGIDVTELLP